MISQKDIIKMYKGKRFDESDPHSTISTISFYSDKAVLMSGKYIRGQSGYYVEAVIDRNTGQNLTPRRTRPAESKADAIDVAEEMLMEE